MSQKPTLSIFGGNGRFGKLFCQLLSSDFKVQVFDPTPTSTPLPEVQQVDFETAVKASTLILAVPIRHLESMVKQIAPLIKPGTTVMDVCSVKIFPAQWMTEHLGEKANLIATHPLFGPNSFNIPSARKITLHNLNAPEQTFSFWKQYFENLNIPVIELSPELHDQIMARSQGITHFIGRILKAMDAKSSPLDTAGFEALLNVMDKTCNDSFDLFADLLHFNPYTTEALECFSEAIDEVLLNLDRNKKLREKL
jgi:prephenate dehydrogenase